MYKQKRKNFNRKRKHEADGIEYVVAKSKHRPFDAKAQREEEELSRDLFGDKSGFLKSLEKLELLPDSSPATDSGLGDTETEESTDESKRKPAWYDEDDDGIEVGSALDLQGRTLPNGGINAHSSQYVNLLEHKFKSVFGTPKWSSLDRKETEEESDLLQSCGHVIDSRSQVLVAERLEYKKVENLNVETNNEGPKITTVEFHPTCTAALVAGEAGIASLIAVDGKRNNKLYNTAYPKFPIHCARFVNDGMDALLGSVKSHFFSFNLNTSKSTKIRLPKGVTQCKKFEVSPNRKILAICGKFGEVHLLTADSKEIITTLKQNNPVTALAFDIDGAQLFGHSDSGIVTIWDVGSRRVKHTWFDDGCLRGTTLAMSPSGQHFASGSAEGVVNLYESESVFREQNPRPKKIMKNLTTSIESLRFNSTSEILGFSSSHLANAVRMLHISSGTVFKNFPPPGSNLRRVNVMSFSPGSGYVAVGNMKNTVSLFRLKHYNNY